MISSVGRASRLHRECRRFEPVITHHPPACHCCAAAPRLGQSCQVHASLAYPRGFRHSVSHHGSCCGQMCRGTPQPVGINERRDASKAAPILQPGNPRAMQITEQLLVGRSGPNHRRGNHIALRNTLNRRDQRIEGDDHGKRCVVPTICKDPHLPWRGAKANPSA